MAKNKTKNLILIIVTMLVTFFIKSEKVSALNYDVDDFTVKFNRDLVCTWRAYIGVDYIVDPKTGYDYGEIRTNDDKCTKEKCRFVVSRDLYNDSVNSNFKETAYDNRLNKIGNCDKWVKYAKTKLSGGDEIILQADEFYDYQGEISDEYDYAGPACLKDGNVYTCIKSDPFALKEVKHITGLTFLNDKAGVISATDDGGWDYFFLVSDRIDGKNSGEGGYTLRRFLNQKIFTSSFYNRVNSYYSRLGEYVNIDNYDLTGNNQNEIFNSFLTYISNSEGTRQKYDYGITQDVWNDRREFMGLMISVKYKLNIVTEFNSEYPGFMDDNVYYKKLKEIYTTLTVKNYKEMKEDSEDSQAILDAVKDDICLLICVDNPSRIEAQKLQCQSGRDDYKKCTECYKTDPSDEAMKECYKQYPNLLAKKEKLEGKVDEFEKATILRAIEPRLVLVFDPANGALDCDDVSVFHAIYVAMTIIAPILVIVFGTIDYFKSVIATDEKKMQEFRKKFTKRLILVVVFVLIPIIVKLILAFNQGLEHSLMDCVVNGK